MSKSTHPITILSDSDIEDAFSSTHSPDYTSASPDYFPASPGNTFSNPSEDLSKHLLASLAISPFHDDLYMKVMQAYNATSNESFIPPQASIASSTVLSSPPVFKIGKSSHKTHLERHEEQIETILNHLDELPFERTEQVEEKIEGLVPLDLSKDTKPYNHAKELKIYSFRIHNWYKSNMYNIDLKNIVPTGGLTCLFAKATKDESKLWHRRLGHLNFKTINKLVKGNLVRGLPSKIFENGQSCVACQKGKQYRASCKTKVKNSISTPLHILHMDLFGLIFVKSLNKKMYCLVVTNDYSRFAWVFFLGTKDETSGTLKSFITSVENLMNLRVKVIRCDNGTEFKNREMNQFCKMKGIMRQYSVAMTLQQNRVAKRRNRTLIEAARTMLADSKMPTTFWAKAVNAACYVQNRVLVTKPHNKTPYELFHGRTPVISFLRLFGCPVTILNTIDHLSKFDGKVDEGFFVGYSLNSKAFRVFNSRTRIVEENLHVRRIDEDLSKENECNDQGEEDSTNSTNIVNTVTLNINVASFSGVNDVGTNISIDLPPDPNMPSLEDIDIFEDSHDDEDIFGDHPLEQAIGDLHLVPQTRRMSKNLEEHGLVGTVILRTNNKDLQNCLFACFLSQLEPQKVLQALKDPSWIEAMQEELLQFKLQNVWTLVDLPQGKRAIGSKWVFRNMMDERGLVIRNKARLVA
nr:retrovirus-related Pol polyprotein from transposon TNT 1-94 [Tanacetum cinerariifolium]